MKLLKLSEEHYIIADKCKLDIKVGDWITDKYSVWQWKDDSSLLGRLKVTHSSEPLRIIHGDNNEETVYYGYLPISEVKELLGLVDVDKKAVNFSKRYSNHDDSQEAVYDGYNEGYKQCLIDNKEKKYTEEQMIEWTMCMIAQYVQGNTNVWDRDMLRKSLPQPKTEWDVEIIDGKLKLK